MVADHLVSVARALQAVASAGSRAGPPLPEADRFLGDFDRLVTNAELVDTSRRLFRDRHYAKAVEEAQKALISFVQERSGSPLDGTKLMMRAFSRNAPLLQVNPLKTLADKDEQEGVMHLFAGAVLMARNPRVHDYRRVDSPDAALALLCFTNHLFGIVEAAKVNKDEVNDRLPA